MRLSMAADLRGLSDEELGAALRAAAIAADPAPIDLWPAVRERILARPVPRGWLWLLRSPRYGLAPLAVTVAVLLLTAVVLSTGAVTAAAEALGLRGVQIFRAPANPTATARATTTPGASGSAATASPGAAALGETVSIADARQRAGFAVVLPSDAALGAPDEVHVRAIPGGLQVNAVYRVRPGVPTSPVAGVAALFSEFRGSVDPGLFVKVLGPDATVEPVVVNGQPGFWIAGAPHQFFYRDGAGNIFPESLRLAGNTLLWEQDGLLLRLEAQVDRATALRIASTVR
ncbi:MAG: hypothetical protein ABR525_08490 [Candidatus Limnocylindria bacterium]